MMDILEIVLESIEKVAGIDKEELREALDLELMEEGVLDSLSLSMVVSNIETKIGKPLNIRDMKPSDFTSVNTLVEAISRKIG